MFFKEFVAGVPIPSDTPECSGLFFLLENPPQILGVDLVLFHLHDFLPSAPGMHIHPLYSGSSRGKNVGMESGKAIFYPEIGFSLKCTTVPIPPLLGVGFLNTSFKIPVRAQDRCLVR